MQELIANSYAFELVDDDTAYYKYDFVSEGVTEVPKRVAIRKIPGAGSSVYNLGFGDITISEDGTETIDDKARNVNKTEGNKILSTAFLCAIDFLSSVDGATVVFFGNTLIKHRLYRMRVCGYLDELNEFLEVKGAILPSYPVVLDDEGFKQITEQIDPATIQYEQFDPKNCSSYNFMTFSIKE